MAESDLDMVIALQNLKARQLDKACLAGACKHPDPADCLPAFAEEVDRLRVALEDAYRIAAAARFTVEELPCQCATAYADRTLVCPRCLAMKLLTRDAQR